MVRTILLTLLTLTIAIAGGGASVWYALENFEGLGALEIGVWTAYPDYGTPGADPYSEARIARDAELTLGSAEGLTFVAETDSAGRILRRNCTYVIEGPVPVTRFWTVYAAGPALQPLQPQTRRGASIHSYQLLRNPDDSFTITVSRIPAPGNWLPLAGNGAFRLVLTLYDTAIASSAAIADIQLPAVMRTGCADA